MRLDQESLATALREAFGGPPGESRAVARMAADLADDGRLATDAGLQVDRELVLAELADAPDGTPADRWNWWIGSLAVAHGGYEEFQIRRFRR